MQLFGPSHLAVLVMTALAVAACFHLARARSRRLCRRFTWALAVMLTLNKLAVLLHAHANGALTLSNALPMHLCDWVTCVVILALVGGGRVVCELAWFWGLGGTLQGLLTPDLRHDFPSFEFLTFFLSHSGVVIGAVFAPLHWRRQFTWRSVTRAFLWLQVYALTATGVNLLAGANYGYLMAKPSRSSLLDFMGDWPWYLLAIEVLALFIFVLLLGVWRRIGPTGVSSLAHSPAAAA